MTTSRLALFVALAAISAAGCASVVEYRSPVPYTAVDARIDETGLQIRCLSREGILYSTSMSPESLRTGVAVPEDSLAVFVLTPTSTGREPPGGRLSGQRLPLLGPEEYRSLRDAVIRAAVPDDGKSAVVVTIGEHDVALYFDADGVFHSLIGEPPPGISVVERLPLSEYLAGSPGELARVLEENGIGSGEVLFNTGDVEDDALPFFYANLDTRTAAFVRVRPLRDARVDGEAGVGSFTSALTHTVASHTVGFVSQPVTSLSRLVLILTDSVQDSFDPVWTLGLESSEIAPLSDSPGMDLIQWEAEIDEITGRESGMGTISHLIDGEAFFTRLEQAVRDAEDSILVRIYIFDNDDHARRFADLLKERSRAGVRVQVLMDGLGTLAAATQSPAGLPEGYEAPASMHDYLDEGARIAVRTAYNVFFAGDHTKTIVIDEKVAFVGGMNIGREYRYEWHDMMAEVQGPVVAELADDFDRAWAGAGFMGDLRIFLLSLGSDREPGPPMGYPVRVLYTRPTSSEIRNVQLAAIQRAERYIYVQNAYFTDDHFLRELVRARRRGVDVRVLIPLQSDRGILGRDNLLTANVMFRNGIRVYIYPGMSHVKAAIYDGWACLGSANIDQLSLRVNREADVATSAPEAVQPLLELLFEADFRASPEMREEFPTHWHDTLWELVGDYVF